MIDDDERCPFCGGTVDPEGWLSSEEDPVTGDALERGPECMNCGATAPDLHTWNMRDVSAMISREALLRGIDAYASDLTSSVMTLITFIERNGAPSESEVFILSRLRAAVEQASVASNLAVELDDRHATRQ